VLKHLAAVVFSPGTPCLMKIGFGVVEAMNTHADGKVVILGLAQQVRRLDQLQPVSPKETLPWAIAICCVALIVDEGSRVCHCQHFFRLHLNDAML